MSLSGRERSCSTLAFLLIITLLYNLASTQYKVEATRILQGEKEASGDVKRFMRKNDHREVRGMRKISSEANHFREFFNGKVSAASEHNNNNKNNNNSIDKGFQDNKRRVPSCPDALHNK